MPRIAIIAPEKEGSFLLPEFRKEFGDENVKLFKPEGIVLSVGNKLEARAGNEGVESFDYILLLPPGPKKEFFYMIARIVGNKVKLSINKETLFYFWNPPALFAKLSRHGVKIVPFFVFAHPSSAQDLAAREGFPLVLSTTLGKRIFVNNEETLEDVLKFFSTGQMVRLRKSIKADAIKVFVCGSEVIGIKISPEVSRIRVGKDLREISRKILEILEADFVELRFLEIEGEYYLDSISLVPSFEEFKEVSGRNLAAVIAAEVKKKLHVPSLGEVLDRIVLEVRKFFGGER